MRHLFESSAAPLLSTITATPSHSAPFPKRPPPTTADDAPSTNDTECQQQQQQQQAWYSQERCILRELIVLTMRRLDGDLLRFVPEEPINVGGNRFSPHSPTLSNGVRLHPNVNVVPQWRNVLDLEDDNDGEGQASSHNFRFGADLSHPLLKSGARDAISLCGECGYLYGRVVDFVDSVLEEGNDYYPCAVTRALAVRLYEELRRYHGELSVLESELPPVEVPLVVSSMGDCGSNRYITLRSLVARLAPMRDHLRTLAILADGVGARNLRGGKLLSAVLAHSLDGGSRHADLVRSIGADCSVPWYNLLRQWITQGVLEDVHSEFFIAEVQSKDVGSSMSSGYFTWHKRFVLVVGQIPLQIMTDDLARNVLLVGKGINFIRLCLQERDWEVFGENDSTPGEETSSDQSPGFTTLMDLKDQDYESRCISTLHDAVITSSSRIHRHILDSLNNRHRLMQHLHAIKQFLFLGQGDFVSSFVESLHQEFRGRTSVAGIYSHTLSSVLEGALRTSNARYLPDYVLARLGVTLMIDERDSDRYSMGPPPKATSDEMIPWEDNEASIQDPWDFVCLEYIIDSPLDAIVHTTAMDSYHQVFLFLFRLKRVEWMLSNSWRQSTALNHAILIETKAGGADAPHISAAAEQSSFLLRRISSTRQTMLHFISNLQNYLMFEVLEGGWEGLVQSVNESQTLDDIISAHDSYLNEILAKTLSSNKVYGNKQGEKGKTLEDQLRKLLSIALKFGKFQDFIFGNALEALSKAAKTRRMVEETSKTGTWGRTTLDKEEGKVFIYLADAKLFHFVEHTARQFDKVLGALLKMLKKEVFDSDYGSSESGDVDPVDSPLTLRNHDALQFLLFRLDFSGYYARQAKLRAKK
ncbi:hypothetical protein HJC23_003305 [Cyclotella cryptica]|uniref:Spindle pole body component n=1 Tax=Cyclotella cryptica TaxID=29204 RepID=A0ABD3QXP2_9STRA|eukprot:CCRYP_000850-RA/>CCRYP_000850-RA protein AED:0.00 eAED:0.00 QI:291/-1/1/1/-1/1/1/60/868